LRPRHDLRQQVKSWHPSNLELPSATEPSATADSGTEGLAGGPAGGKGKPVFAGDGLAMILRWGWKGGK